MANRKESFIKGLSELCKPVRPLPRPSVRGAVWSVVALVVAVGLTWMVQPFRPGFMEQLATHPVFVAEVVSGLLLVPLTAYALLVLSVPGGRVPVSVIVLLSFLATVFLFCQPLAFAGLAPESTMVGKRAACWLEVIIYGTILLALIHWFLRKAMPRFGWRGRIATGLCAGLLPAVLMEIACLYEPHHQVHYHYLPMLVPVLCALAHHAVRRR